MLQQNSLMNTHSLSLVLSYGPLGLIRATETLIGQDSIYVNTGRIALNNHSEVEIVLSIRTGNVSKTYRIPATVSGTDQRGVKLQFKDCNKASLEALLPFVTLH